MLHPYRVLLLIVTGWAGLFGMLGLGLASPEKTTYVSYRQNLVCYLHNGNYICYEENQQ